MWHRQGQIKFVKPFTFKNFIECIKSLSTFIRTFTSSIFFEELKFSKLSFTIVRCVRHQLRLRHYFALEWQRMNPQQRQVMQETTN